MAHPDQGIQYKSFQPAILFDRLDDDLDWCRDVNDAASRVLGATIALHRAQFGTLQLLTTGGDLMIVAQQGFQPGFLNAFSLISASDSDPSGRALHERTSVVVQDVCIDTAFAPYRHIAAEAGYRAVQSTPMVASNGGVAGVLSTHFTRTHAPSALEMAMARVYGRAAADTLLRLAGRRIAPHDLIG